MGYVCICHPHRCIVSRDQHKPPSQIEHGSFSQKHWLIAYQLKCYWFNKLLSFPTISISLRKLLDLLLLMLLWAFVNTRQLLIDDPFVLFSCLFWIRIGFSLALPISSLFLYAKTQKIIPTHRINEINTKFAHRIYESKCKSLGGCGHDGSRASSLSSCLFNQIGKLKQTDSVSKGIVLFIWSILKVFGIDIEGPKIQPKTITFQMHERVCVCMCGIKRKRDFIFIFSIFSICLTNITKRNRFRCSIIRTKSILFGCMWLRTNVTYSNNNGIEIEPFSFLFISATYYTNILWLY